MTTMTRHGPLLVLLVALAALVGGLALLFQRRVAQGDLFPAYSSLRADPLGLRALHDSLAQVPGVGVERQFKALAEIEPAPARTILLAGIRPQSWAKTRPGDFAALDGAVRRGSRLVLGLRATAAQTEQEKTEEAKREEKDEQRQREAAEDTGREKVGYVDLRRRWGAEVKERVLVDRSGGAVATEEARAAGLPAEIAWRSDAYFSLEAEAGWRVLYRRGAEPVGVERKLGLGSIVLMADSYLLSNEALQNDRVPALLAWLVGPHVRVTFDEAHLGVVAQAGVAALARRYGLTGAFVTLLILALLFVWRRMALFVPPTNESGEVALTYHPAAGLEALLRRSVPPQDLAAVCATEWRATARASDQARVDVALAAEPKNSPAFVRYNAAARALKRR